MLPRALPPNCGGALPPYHPCQRAPEAIGKVAGALISLPGAPLPGLQGGGATADHPRWTAAPALLAGLAAAQAALLPPGAQGSSGCSKQFKAMRG